MDGSGALYVFNPSTSARTGSPGDAARDRTHTVITRTVVQTPWQRSQSACWGDRFYMVNGVDRPLTFDGYFWDYAGWPGPAGTPTASPMNAPHATDNGATPTIKIPNIGLGSTSETTGEDYKFARRYRVSFVNNRGAESPLSEPSEIIYFVNVGGEDIDEGVHFAKLDLPTGPPETVKRRVYATQNLYDSSSTLVTGRDTQFYYHSEIDDAGTATIMDSLPDGFLGALVDPNQFGAWPVNARFIASFNGRMYASGANNSEVYYSRRGNPEVWPVDNVLDVGDAYLGPVTAMYATRNVLLVAKARGIYLIVDDGVNEPVARTLTRESGWIAHNTVREIPGVGIFGLSDDGITMLKGTLQNEGVETQTFNAGVVLPKTMAKINRAAMANACAAVYHKDKELWIAVPTLGNSNNNLVLVYHYEVREWSVRYNYPISSILEDSSGHLIFGSYASTTALSPDGVAHLGIMVYSRGFSGKDEYAATPTAIQPVYETNPITIASAFRTFKPLHVLVYCILHGKNDLTMNLRANGKQGLWLDAYDRVNQEYPQEYNPVYGEATFDTGKVWQSWRPGTVRFDVTSSVQQPVFECAIRLVPASRYMTLLNLSLEIQPGDPAGTKPLKPDAGS